MHAHASRVYLGTQPTLPKPRPCPSQDVVLGRKTVGVVRGDILVNGHPKVQATWSRVCGWALGLGGGRPAA